MVTKVTKVDNLDPREKQYQNFSTDVDVSVYRIACDVFANGMFRILSGIKRLIGCVSHFISNKAPADTTQWKKIKDLYRKKLQVKIKQDEPEFNPRFVARVRGAQDFTRALYAARQRRQ